MPDFYAKLRFQQSLLILLLALMLGFAVLGTFSLAVLLCQGIDGAVPFQEETAWRTLIGLGLGSLALALGGLLWLALKRPRPMDLARLVEERHPELHETLTTAMEIQERGGPANALEEALFRNVEAKCAEINLKRDSLPRLVHPASVLLLIAVAMVLSDFAGKSEFVMKARFYQLDRMAGESTGLLVKPGDAELPRADDLTVTAEITRWQNDPVIVYEQDGRTERYPMTAQVGEPASFTFFGIVEPLRYRVETSSLHSPWYAVTVYDPPTIEALTLAATPPAYTREELTEYTRLVDLHLPEGSAVSLKLATQPGVTGALRVSGDSEPMGSTEGGSLTGSFVVQSDGDYQVLLTNAEGRRLVTPSFEIDVIPDEPPVIEITEPGQDTQAKPEGAVPFGIFAGDDYGLSRVELHLSVSGLDRSPQIIFEAGDEPTLETELLGALEIAEQGAQHGDIITYYAVAWDNREPEAQSARSDVFFVEVLTDVPEQEGEKSEGQGEGQRDEINLRAIIVELKRLMRMAHAAIPQTGERRAESMQALATGIAEARKETSVALERLTMMFMQMAMQGNEDGRAMADLLVVAMENMVEAELQANQDDPESVNPTLAEALSNLLIVESFAKSQPQMQSSSGGAGEPSEGNSQASGEPKQGQQGKQSQASLADLQQDLEELNRLMDDQAEQNAALDRADGQNLGEAEQSELLGSQTEIDNRVGILENRLKRGLMEQTSELRSYLKGAQASMRKSAGATRQGEYGAAARDGIRSRHNLEVARNLMNGLIRSMAAGQLAGISEQAGELAARQEAARQASEAAEGSAPGEDAARQMRQQQDALREQLEELIAEMQREAVDLESTNPKAGQALGQAARNARRANTTGEMQRAANALLYERYGRAEQHQGEAASQLGDLQASLGEAMKELATLSASELSQYAQQIADMQKQLAKRSQQGGQQSGEGDSELAESLQKLGNELGKAGKSLSNDNLVELGQNLEATKEGDAGSLTEARLGPSLDQAARIIQQYLRGEVIGERLRMNQDSAPPPEQYRRLVEEYFKNLAEEQQR